MYHSYTVLTVSVHNSLVSASHAQQRFTHTFTFASLTLVLVLMGLAVGLVVGLAVGLVVDLLSVSSTLLTEASL